MPPYELRSLSKVYLIGNETIVKAIYCATLNQFILVDSGGKLFLTDGNGEVIFGPISTGSKCSNICVDYSNAHNSLLAWDNEKFSSRRNLGGTWLLRTILAAKPDVKNSPDADVNVELTLNEASKLLQYLRAPSVKFVCQNENLLKELLVDLQTNVDEAKEAEKAIRGHKWASVVLRGPYSFLLTTMTSALTELKQSGLTSPILPIISAVVERLNLLKEDPYIFEVAANGDQSPVDKSIMASEAVRRLTFSQWPHMDYKWALPDQMAEAGFFHQPNSDGDDRVFCFTCTVCLVCWEPADEPWSEHERHAPTCPFVKGEYTQNVPISVVYASTSALPHECADEIVCVSKPTSCDVAATSTRYGEIVLWNLAKDLKKCSPIVLDPSEPFVEMKTGYRCRPRRHLRSGIAWADETDLLGHGASTSPISVGNEHTNDGSESSNNEIANEIVAVCPQKGDFVVTAISTCSQPISKRLTSEVIDPNTRCSAALLVGCGIIESKIRSEQRISETYSPSSFVENLNTVNKATSTLNDCIIPPSMSAPDAPCSSYSDGTHQPSGFAVRYRPFILVYKIEEKEENDDRLVYSDKSRRTGTSISQATALEKSVLASVKEINESPSISDEYDEIDNGLDDKNDSMDIGESMDDSNKEIELSKEVFPIGVHSTPIYGDFATGVVATSAAYDSVSSVPIVNTPSVIDGPVDSISSSLGSMKTAMAYESSSKTSPAVPSFDQMVVTDSAKPFKVSLAILQCLRLPFHLDSIYYYVHNIVPLSDGSGVFVVINRNEIPFTNEKGSTSGDTICSAILFYKLSFSCHLASLAEQPYRQINFGADVGFIESVLHIQSSGIEDEMASNLVVVLNRSGEIRVVNVENSGTVAKMSPLFSGKYTAICGYQDDKICACCDDGSVCMLELLRSEPLVEDFDSPNFMSVEDSSQWKDADLLVNKPLSLDVLKDLWHLTRSDWATTGQCNVQPWGPSSWVEVQQHQRLRKNPQHYLREEKLAKSWHLIPDSDSWREHIFEVTLPANFSASHVDFRFVLQQSAVVGMPPIQVTFLRQLPKVGSRASSTIRDWFPGLEAGATSGSDAPGSSSSLSEVDDHSSLKNRVFDKNFLDDLHAEVVAGPYDLHTALDLYDLNGLIQFSPPQSNNAKMRTFLIHIQALSKAGMDSSKLKVAEQKKPVQKVSSASNLSSAEKTFLMSTGGLYQQKYGATKYGIPSGKTSSASNVRVLATKNLNDARKNENLTGCDWIQEVSITVWRTTKTALKKERKQRLAMIKSTDFVAKLVKTIVSGMLETKGASDGDPINYQLYVILDLLIWINQQGTLEDKNMVKTLARAFESHLDGLFRSCYVMSNRSISRKFTILIADILTKLKAIDHEVFKSFLNSIKETLSRFVLNLDNYRNSGSSVWLLALAEEIYKLSPAGCSIFIIQLQEFACTVGQVLKQRSDLRHNNNLMRYGLNSSPFELEMFELPPPTLTLLQRSQQPFTYATVTSTGTALVANISSDCTHDENDWLEIVGVDFTPPGGTSTKVQRQGRTVRLEREHIYGLIEVEPLHFVCYSASDGIKLENLETGVSMSVTTAPNLVPTSTGAGPIPLPDMSQYEQSGNPALTNAVTSMKQQVQNILSKQMQLLAIQQQKQKLQVKLTDHVEKLANLAAEQIPATQASSASTFGVPTTPKTTPFMTPTPLSPSHLSPINSEVDLHFEDTNIEAENRLYGSNTNEECPKLVPTEFLKPPPAQALVVDRMTSGARKFVVLNFECPVLLTDLIIPQCGDISSLSVDVWLKSESDDGQRLVVCSDISQKTLVLCDLQPPCLCQYLKITYIARQGLGSCTSKIPLGNFYGYTYATPLQLAITDITGNTNGRIRDDTKLLRRPCLSIEQLRQLEEDVVCRYGLSCELLQSLLDSSDSYTSSGGKGNIEKDMESIMIREVCKEIWRIRVQWNLLHRTIERIRPTISSAEIAGSTNRGIGFDKARVISELLFTSLLRLSPLMRLDVEFHTVRISGLDDKAILPLHQAVEIFERFCASGITNLIALSVAWILHHGSYSDWWGSFFGIVLEKFFTVDSTLEQNHNIFLILSFLVDRGLAAGNNMVFLDLLQRLNNLLSDGVVSLDNRQSVQMTLMLLSHCFDSYPQARILGSKWDFLLGEYSKKRHSSPKTDGGFDNVASQQNTRVFTLHTDPVSQPHQENLIAQHHQKVMQLSSELKEYVKTKTVKEPTFFKHKPPAPMSFPYVQSSSGGYVTFPGGAKTKDSRIPQAVSRSVAEKSNSAEGGSNSSSQKKSRLKLPYELSQSVARKLAASILLNEKLCSTETYILMCKVMSCISRCSRPLLHIMDVFLEPGQLHQLLQMLVKSQNIYVRRALVCLSQDFLIAEAKCDNSRSSSSKGLVTSIQATAHPAGTESSGTSVESELDTRTNGQPVAAASVTERDLTNDLVHGLATASAKYTGDKLVDFHSAEVPDTDLQWNLPKTVDTPAGAQAYIESWVNTIKPVPLSNIKVSNEKRQQRFRKLYREVLYAHASKFGLSWLQDTKACSSYMEVISKAEADLAKKAQSEAYYNAGMDKLTPTFLAPVAMSDMMNVMEMKSFQEPMEKTVGNDALAEVAKAAVNAAVNAVNAPSIVLSSADWTVLSSGTSGAVPASSSNFTADASTLQGGSVPQFSTQPSGLWPYTPMAPVVSGQNLAEAKEALWKLCEQLNASAPKASNAQAYMSLTDIPPPPPPPMLSSLNTADTINLDLGFGSTSLNSASLIADGALLWDDDSDSEGTPMEPEASTAALSSFMTANTNQSQSAPAHLWKVYAAYPGFEKSDFISGDNGTTKLENIQPISLALDERMESQLGWQAEIAVRRWLLVNNTYLRTFLQNATSFQKPLNTSLSQREHRASHVHVSSAAAISDAFTNLFDNLSPSSNPTFVDNLLDICWLLSVGNETKTKELPFLATVRAVQLGEKAIKKLLLWLLEGVGVSDKIWCLSMRILAASVRVKNNETMPSVSPASTYSIIEDPNFAKVLHRLLTKARTFGSSDLAGPAVVQSLSDLLTCLHLHLSNASQRHVDRMRHIIVAVLLDLLNERDIRSLSQVPLDIVNKLVEFLLNQPGFYRFEQRLATDYIDSLCINVMDYLLATDTSSDALLPIGAANPRYCFLIGKPELATNEFRCFLDRLEVMMVNLLKLASRLLNCSAISSLDEKEMSRQAGESLTDDAKAGVSTMGIFIAEGILDLKPSLVASLLNSIGLCYCGNQSKADSTDMAELCGVIPVTVADSLVQILLMLFHRAVGSRLTNLLAVVVNFLFFQLSTYEQANISDLSIYVLLRIFDRCAAPHLNSRAIQDTRLITVLAEQLVHCCETIEPIPSIEHSHLLKSAAAVCGRGPKSGDLTTKKLLDTKVDGLTNFAPLCSIASSSPMAHHLSALLSSAPPHRRARNAAWSYHFYPAENWLDMTLTLPYSIILKEIQIRPHLASLQSSPSAVQVELSPDSNASSFRSFVSPLVTAGCTKIRIPIDLSMSPVRMVRLHLKRPIDSSNLGMSQILLLGHTPMSAEVLVEDPRLKWLQLFHYSLTLAPTSFFQRSNVKLFTELSRKLVEMFLCVPLSAIAYGQLIDIFVLLETHHNQVGADAPFIWLLKRVGTSECPYRLQSWVWLAELMSRLCSNESNHIDRSKISKMIHWITEALEAYSAGGQIPHSTMTCIIWCCSCILWRGGKNLTGNVISARPETLLKLLYKCARDCKDDHLAMACGYLLCSIIRAYPEHLDDILRLCGLGNFGNVSTINDSDENKKTKSTHQNPSALNSADLRVLSFACQSRVALLTMESYGILDYLVNTLTSLCIEGEKNINLIIAIVQFLKEVSIDGYIKRWLATNAGSVFWVPLLSFMCISQRSSALKDEWQLLESSTISLICRFVSCHDEGQRLVSKLLCQLLTELNGGLNGSIQQLILRVLLEDEKLTLLVEDSKVVKTNLRVHHPQYGCGIHTVIKDMSVYAICSQLLPDAVSRKVLVKAYKKPCSFSDFSDPSPFYGGDFMVADFTLAGEKAKAKRASTKSAQNDGKGELGWKSNANTSGAAPIAYVSHETFGKTNPLPGVLTVSQLHRKVSSMSDEGPLRLAILYAMPSEITIMSNDELLHVPAYQSTLEVFARQGGLALLAEHLQLYQPTIGIQSAGGRFGYNETEWKILEEMQSSADKQFLNEAELTDYYDPSYEWVNVAPSGLEGYITDPKAHLNGRMRNMINVGLSPHVVVCFGVFLRLTGYAELLVTQDRRQAQWLLRLALGITTDAGGANIANNSEAASMGTLPFEILASLYWASSWNTDEGRLVRTLSFDLGIPQLLLQCLMVFSHQNERRTTSNEAKPEVVRIVDRLLAALASTESQPGGVQHPVDEKSHLYWAKGTGFGTGSTQQQWDQNLHIIKQKQDEQSVACLLKVLAQFIFPGKVTDTQVLADDSHPSVSASDSQLMALNTLPSWWSNFVRIISDSCLLPTLQSYLRNDSVLDISRHVSVYESVLRLLCSLALTPQLSDLLTELGEQQQSLRSLLAKLKDCVDIYISKLEPLRKTGDAVGSEDAATEEGLLKLVPLIERTSSLVQQFKSDADTEMRGRRRSSGCVSLSIMSNEQRYIRTMKSLQFDSFKFLCGNNGEIRFAVPYHYEASVQGASKDISTLAPCVRRLAQEAVTLSTSLPLSYSSSVFVRTADERLDIMKVLITGPHDTPYANGCFEFDVWFPTDYPNAPMHINLQTTGGSTVRFNPNLYNDGKVCLSILNTWHGRPEERWNAQTSSFLQVLVSIQSLILVPDPYFNEPGYERSRGTPAGQLASREYDANISQATVRWGMLEMLRNPPSCFKEVIQRHFWIKRDEIIKQVEGWISDMESGGSGGNADKRIQRNLLAHLASMKRHFAALKEEFAKMSCPDGLEEESYGNTSGVSLVCEKTIGEL